MKTRKSLLSILGWFCIYLVGGITATTYTLQSNGTGNYLSGEKTPELITGAVIWLIWGLSLSYLFTKPAKAEERVTIAK